MFVVVDAKGLWTNIQAYHKTEKRGTIYIRRMMDILNRVGATVYFWVNSGHMLADCMTKLSAKQQPPATDLMLYTLDSNMIRIMYCEGSWKRNWAHGRQAS